MKKKTAVRRKKAHHVAVVVANVVEIPNLAQSGRNPHGDWGSFVGTDRDKVVAAALKARQDWTRGAYGPYRILIGTLTEEIVTPTNYKAVKL